MELIFEQKNELAKSWLVGEGKFVADFTAMTNSKKGIQLFNLYLDMYDESKNESKNDSERLQAESDFKQLLMETAKEYGLDFILKDMGAVFN